MVNVTNIKKAKPKRALGILAPRRSLAVCGGPVGYQLALVVVLICADLNKIRPREYCSWVFHTQCHPNMTLTAEVTGKLPIFLFTRQRRNPGELGRP